MDNENKKEIRELVEMFKALSPQRQALVMSNIAILRASELAEKTGMARIALAEKNIKENAGVAAG